VGAGAKPSSLRWGETWRDLTPLILVGGLEHFDFSIYWEYLGIIIPTDFHSIIFQRGRLKPPTRY